jgi:broad specificity phosphatase PhoE
LNSNGIRQAESLAEDLQKSAPDVVFSSDLVRAYQTSKIIAARLNLPVFTSCGLREVDVGAAEGLGYEQTVERFGHEAIARWRSLQPAELSFAFPEGETKQEALERAKKVIVDFLQGRGEERVAIVSHGMLIRTFLHHLFPHLDMPSVLSNCGYVTVDYELSAGEWSLLGDDC